MYNWKHSKRYSWIWYTPIKGMTAFLNYKWGSTVVMDLLVRYWQPTANKNVLKRKSHLITLDVIPTQFPFIKWFLYRLGNAPSSTMGLFLKEHLLLSFFYRCKHLMGTNLPSQAIFVTTKWSIEERLPDLQCRWSLVIDHLVDVYHLSPLQATLRILPLLVPETNCRRGNFYVLVSQ